jgi:hypothetical protein
MFDWLTFTGTVIGTIAAILFLTSPVWLPIVLGGAAWGLWVDYIRRREISKKEFILLEIRIPKEIKKSPAAMEVIFNALTSGAVSGWYKTYWKGEMQPWYSLEVISVGGAIHFLIWTDKKSKNLLEAQIYSQYPGVEIYEVPDYAKDVVYNPEINKMWGTEIILTKPDPYPIKTYVDYGVDPDKDSGIDPMSVMLEYLGTLEQGQQAWVQILIRSHVKVNDIDTWKDEAKKEIEGILSKGKLQSKDDDPHTPKVAVLSEDQKEQIKALEKNINKPGFACGIRIILMTDADKFDPGRIGGLLNSFKQYSSHNLNGFKPNNTTGVKYPWYDFREHRVNKMKKNILDAYKRRSYFYAPYKGKPFILNTEELATIYHFPGKAIQTPTLGRISSKKAEPPSNLPI